MGLDDWLRYEQRRRPAPTFEKVWYASMVNVGLAALPLELLGVEWWATFAGYWCMFGIGFFLSAEIAAKDLARQWSGTKTSWLFWKIHSDERPWLATLGRVLLGLAIGLVVYWRIPQAGELELWGWETSWSQFLVGGFFVTWLPYHYVKPRVRFLWEWVAQWLVDHTPLGWLYRKLDD